MAVDLKVEIFSDDLFRHIWHKCRAVSFDTTPSSQCFVNGKIEKSEFNNEILHAVWCRQHFFREQNAKFLLAEYDKFSNSGTDFCVFIQDMFGFYPYFKNLNIFDKVLTTSAFVAEMGICCFNKRNCMYQYYGPLCWAMYFDSELKEEFYAEGGWKDFTRYSDMYRSSLLNEEKILSSFVFVEDVRNIYNFARAAYSDYNMAPILNTFKERSSKHKENPFCSRCFPLFCAFTYLCGDTRNSLLDARNIVEGLLQLCLHLMPDEELLAFKLNFVCNSNSFPSGSDEGIKAQKAVQSTNVSSPTNVNNNEEICEQSAENESASQTAENEETFDEVVAMVNISRFFKCYQPDQENNLDLCIFCCRNMKEPSLDTKKERQLNQVKYIKSLISKTRTELESITADHEFEKNQVTSGMKKADNSEISQAAFEMGSANNETDCADVKDALGMFLALGVEPVKSNMLSILKGNTDTKGSGGSMNIEEEFCSLSIKDILHASSPQVNTKSKKKKKNPKGVQKS